MSRITLVALALGASLVSACGDKPAPPPPPPTPPAAQPVAALPEGQYAVCAACHQASPSIPENSVRPAFQAPSSSCRL